MDSNRTLYKQPRKHENKSMANNNKRSSKKGKEFNKGHTLVLEGGGAKGISYAEAIPLLDLTKFSRVVGSSAGAFTALMIAAGVDKEMIRKRALEPMRDIVSTETYNQFNNKSNYEALRIIHKKKAETSTTNQLEDQMRDTIYERWTKLRWMANKIIQSQDSDAVINDLKEKEGFKVDESTFAREYDQSSLQIKESASQIDQIISSITKEEVVEKYTFNLHNVLMQLLTNLHIDAGMKELMVTATMLKERGEGCSKIPAQDHLKIFESTNKEDGDVSIIKAAAASGSFPGVFKEVTIKGRNYIDGGILNNDPVDVAIKKMEEEKESGKIVSLRLNPIEDLDKRKHDMELYKVADNLMMYAISQHYGFDKVVNLDGVKEMQKEKNKLMKEYKKKDKLIEIGIKPEQIGTLKMDKLPIPEIETELEHVRNKMLEAGKVWGILDKTKISENPAENTSDEEEVDTAEYVIHDDKLAPIITQDINYDEVFHDRPKRQRERPNNNRLIITSTKKEEE